MLTGKASITQICESLFSLAGNLGRFCDVSGSATERTLGHNFTLY